MILAIDPGSAESAYVVLDDNLKPVEFGKFANESVKAEIRRIGNRYYTQNDTVNVVIECIASYGMSVGQTVFDTCIWIGRFTEMAEQSGLLTNYIYRKDEKINLCGTMKAKDSNIIQALKDRFGEKGTKKAPGWFYGFSKDVWQAYAVGITYYDMYLKDK